METTDPIFLSIVSVAIAALGLALAFGSWWTAQRALAKATERDDREVIVYLHDAFAQKSEARAALHRAYRERGPDWWRHEDEGGLDQANIFINSALAELNMMAIHVELGFIDERVAQRFWGVAAANCWFKAKGYVDYRRGQGFPEHWVELEHFVDALPGKIRDRVQTNLHVPDVASRATGDEGGSHDSSTDR